MSLDKKLESTVEGVMQTDTVQKAQSLLGSRTGVGAIAAISFVEAVLPLPILTDPFLVAAILANKKNAVQLVIVTTVTSMLGGVVAYFMATFFLDILLSWFNAGLVSQFQEMVSSNSSGTFMLTVIGAVTPVPYTLVAWGVAVLKGSLLVFVLASIFGRGLRYSIVGFATYRFGEDAVRYAKRYIIEVSIVLLVIIALFTWLNM